MMKSGQLIWLNRICREHDYIVNFLGFKLAHCMSTKISHHFMPFQFIVSVIALLGLLSLNKQAPAHKIIIGVDPCRVTQV